MKVNYNIWLWLSLLLYVVIAVVYALLIPPYFNVAENFVPAFNLAQHGFMGMGDTPYGMTYMQDADKYTYFLPPLHYLSLAGWVKVFDCTLFQVRLQTIAWGVVLLCGLYYIGSDYQGIIRRLGFKPHKHMRRIGIWAVLFCALNYAFLNIPDGHMDMMCAALGIWSLALGTEWLAAASFMVHPFGGLYGLILAIKHKRVRWVPYVVALALWGLYIMQAPDIWWQQFGGNFIWHFESGGPIIFTPGVFIGFGDGWRNVLLVVYLVCAYLTARRNKAMATWFIPVAIGAFMLARNVNYFPHILPMLSLCVAIQMRKYPWLALFLVLEIVFAARSL